MSFERFLPHQANTFVDNAESKTVAKKVRFNEQLQVTTDVSPEKELREQIAWKYVFGWGWNGIEVGALHSPLAVSFSQS